MGRRNTRRLGILGLLWASWPAKLVALGLTVALLAGTAGDAIVGLPGSAGPDGRGGAAHGPGQRWGTAAGGGSHVEGSGKNRTVPASFRSAYPALTWNTAQNSAELAAAPEVPRHGFDAATSKEIPEARDAYDRTYTNTDGTETTEFSSVPVNYRTPDGWAPIDTRLTADADGWRNTADSVGLRFAPRADRGELATVSTGGGRQVSFGLSGAAGSAGEVTGSTVTYRGVRPQTDLELESRPGGVKETVVLTSRDAPASFVFPLHTNGLTPRLDGGQVVLADAAGVTRAVIPAGDMTDAAQARSTGVTYRLVDGPALEVTLDTAWLNDPARVYPVRVDPTVQVPVDGAAADSAMYVQGSSSASGSSQLLVGTVDGQNSASYLRFGGLVSKLQYHTIFGAALWAVNYDSDSCQARQVSVHPVTSSWTAGSGYSYPGPSVGAALTSKSFAHGYIAFGQSSSACPTAGEVFDLGADGRDLVQRWVDGTQANYGLSLRASTDSLSGKRFTGTGTANPPKLYVTHSPYNAAYAIPNPVPNPTVLQNQDGKIKVTVTNKSAADWAASDYYLAYRAYNADTGAAVTQQRSASLTATVTRGGKVTLDATIKALPPGKYFLDFTMVKTGGVVFTDYQVPPARLVLQVFDIPPVVQELYPPNGYQAPTLTPQLWARALDIDAPPSSSLQFKFEICQRDDAGNPTGCTNSGYGTKTAWTVPSGTLSWSRAYLWRTYVKDATTEVVSPYSALLAWVPQPDVTSRLAGAPYGERQQEFDPLVGNYSTVAVDAVVATAGPELTLTRTYNSLDPRRDGLFGAGWTSRYDMKLVTDDDGSGNVVVTYPDGQEVRFGKNADGTYAAPWGRTASLTVDSTSWKLLDTSGTTYQFSLAGRLTRITDNSSHAVVLSYDTTTGKLAKAQVSNSQTNTAGRSLTFTWTGAHVTNVKTDPVDGAALAWDYTYTGDLLTKVCGPGSACTGYEYAAGSHYRNAVLDSRPESYWRLGEGDGTAAGSEVTVNLGKDAGTYSGITLGTVGPIAGSPDTAASFNGTTSKVDLPKGTLKKGRDGAVELWFKNSLTGSGGPLLGYQDKALGTASTTGVPVLYVGTDGKLRGQFGTGSINPITSATAVNDGKWHHVVLSSMGSTQTLYLDGAKVGDLTGKTIDHSLLTFNQIGAAYATTPASWPAWGSAAQRSYAGAIDEVAYYTGPLGAAAVAAHYKAGTAQADQLTRVALPSGKTASAATYDVVKDRVKDYTDDNGGRWKIGTPTVYGGSTDLRRSVEVLDPADRPSLYEYDAIGGWLLRLGQPLGLETRSEDAPGEPVPTSPPPTESCTTPDANDPSFCTTIPGDSGGPVFVRYDAEGTSIRSFGYDADGNLATVTDENGDTTSLTYDKRGNVDSTKTCRSATECHTSYTTYPATVTNLYDPRNNLPTETRDARSPSATDTTYRTSYTYHPSGQVLTQTNPDGSSLKNTYTTGAEAAVGGGIPPSGLLATATDIRGKVTKYEYYANGDLARLTEPSGLVTEFTYDAIGRKISEKEISDSFPAGIVTTYTYDGMSRPLTQTDPVTTNAVTGAKHQQRTANTYDADGNLTAATLSDVLGNDPARVTTTLYDEHNHPILVTDPEGGERVRNYDVFGNLTTEIDPGGNRYDLAYTARNSIAEVRLRDWHSDPDGAPATGTGDYLVLRSYSYDFAGRLASRTDAMGRRTEYQYYGDGLLHKEVLKNFHDPDGSTRDFVVQDNTYDADGNLTTKVTGNGRNTEQYTIDVMGRVSSMVEDPGGLGRTTSYNFDAEGNVTRSTLSGKASNVPWITSATPETSEYAYDDNGNLTDATITDGTTRLTTHYGYDQRGLRVSVTDPRGGDAYTSRTTYDEAGRAVTVTGAPVAAESGGGAASTVKPVKTFGYDTFGEQTEAADELGNVGRTTYDRNGRPVSAADPAYTAPGASGAITPTTLISYDRNGNVVSVTDPRGGITRRSYDQLNRLVGVDEPASTNDERAVTSYTYSRTGKVLSSTDPTGARTEATYDDLDRQVTDTVVERRPAAAAYTTKVTYNDSGDVLAAVSPSGAVTSNTYDLLGRLTKTIDPSGLPEEFGYDFAGRQVRGADGLGRTSQQSYDLFGRLAASADLAPDGTTLRTTRYGYDPAGNLTSVTDPNQTTRSYAYDAANRLVGQTEPVTDTRSITTTFGYDAAGHRTRYTDGRGNATITTYNSLGLPETEIEPATATAPNLADRTWTTAYDANGNAVAETEPGGVTTQATYDAADRLVTETGTGAEAATATRHLGYDLAGRTTSIDAVTGTNYYSYDDRGNLLGSGGPGGTSSFAYDGDGNMTVRKDAAGNATYGYTNGRLASMTDGLTGATETLGYDGSGAVKTVSYGGGRTRTFGYDNLGHQISDVLTNQAGQTVSSAAYAFGLDDSLTRETTTGTAGAGDFTYTYDKAGRLTGRTGGGQTTAYGWDDAGNRVQNGAKTATYDERNRLLSDGDYTYTYSTRGTVASRTSAGLTDRFAFDAFDRLITAAGQNYVYDSLDRMVSRNGTGFTYAGPDGEVVSDGAQSFARGPEDELLATGRGDTKRLSLSDNHGDVVGGFDPADTTLAQLPDSTGYDPFGKVTAKTGDTGALSFQGDWTDSATGQVNMGARWYDPGTGGFVSRDSITSDTGENAVMANRYTYGAADPLDFTDPDGHKAEPSDTVESCDGGPNDDFFGCFQYQFYFVSLALERQAQAQADAAAHKHHKSAPGANDTYPSYAPGPAYRGSGGGGSCGACYDPYAAYKRAKRISDAAIASNAYRARTTHIGVSSSARTPNFSGGKIVSSSPSVPARATGAKRNVVADQKKGSDRIY
ncbi:DNRLRE domain-containing protein, partial [Amycolatopsis rhizosphaerae]